MTEPDRRTPLDRVLNLFTDVRTGESSTALLLTANVFLLLTAYYIIKPVREALILAGGGAEVKSYAAAGQALLLLVAVPAYARLASRLPRLRLITVVTLFFVACLVVFYLLARVGVPLGIPFYLWVGIFNLMIVAQFWSFANDIYTPDEGKRLFAIVAFGASAGAVFGSVITGWLIGPLGVFQLMLLSAALLLVSLALTQAAAARRRRERAGRTAVDPAERASEAAGKVRVEDVEGQALGDGSAWALLWRNRYLLLIAFLLLMANWVNTTGEYLLGRLVAETADTMVAEGTSGGLSKADTIGKFYADFFFWVNVAGLATQLFLVSRAIKYLGVRICLLILPAIALGGYVLLALVPVLAVVRWAKTAENATDYSLQNTVRNILFLPTTREEKYKAKQAIDTFFVRAGDVLSAALVYVGAEILSLSIRGFAVVNIVLVLIWIVIAVAVGKRFQELQGEASG